MQNWKFECYCCDGIMTYSENKLMEDMQWVSFICPKCGQQLSTSQDNPRIMKSLVREVHQDKVE